MISQSWGEEKTVEGKREKGGIGLDSWMGKESVGEDRQ